MYLLYGFLRVPIFLNHTVGNVQIPLAGAGCAFFQFHELCEMPLGAADFIGLFSKYLLSIVIFFPVEPSN